MAKNDYARLLTENARLKQDLDVLSRALGNAFRWGTQLAFDLLTITMNDPAVMGRDTFGPARLRRIESAVNELYKEAHKALSNDPEADYTREVIDRRLRQIIPDAAPWEERYEGWTTGNKEKED